MPYHLLAYCFCSFIVGVFVGGCLVVAYAEWMDNDSLIEYEEELKSRITGE